jgi:hypothetical protein
VRGTSAPETAPIVELFVSPSKTTAKERLADSFVLARIWLFPKLKRSAIPPISGVEL